jgi:hypothetical protein
VPPKPLPFETLHEGSAIRFLGSVYVTARIAAVVRRLLPRVLHLLPGGVHLHHLLRHDKCIFIDNITT